MIVIWSAEFPTLMLLHHIYEILIWITSYLKPPVLHKAGISVMPLTDLGFVMPYGDIDLGQYWLIPMVESMLISH